jgi:hypothetical protein
MMAVASQPQNHNQTPNGKYQQHVDNTPVTVLLACNLKLCWESTRATGLVPAAAAHLEACHQLASDPLDSRHQARCFTGHTMLPLLMTGTQLGVFLDGLDAWTLHLSDS